MAGAEAVQQAVEQPVPVGAGSGGHPGEQRGLLLEPVARDGREAAREQGQGQLEVERIQPRRTLQQALAEPSGDVLEGGA